MAKSQKEQIKELKDQLAKAHEAVEFVNTENMELRSKLGLPSEPSHMDEIHKLETDALVAISETIQECEEKTGRPLKCSDKVHEIGVEVSFLDKRYTGAGKRLRTAMNNLGRDIKLNYEFKNIQDFWNWARPIIEAGYRNAEDLE